MKLLIKKYSVALLITLILSGCEKFVDIQPKGQLIPTTVEDFRSLLDHVQFMNFTGSLGELAADDIYFNDAQYQSIGSPFERNTYVWNRNIYMPQDQAVDWNTPFSRIHTVNVILEGLLKTDTGTPLMRSTIEGEALFQRAIAHFEVANLYAKNYNPATADTDLGIPIRLASDVFVRSVRPSLAETYQQILDDLHTAIPLLPRKATVATRASQVAAYGMLARIYLDMSDYEQALENALAALAIQPDLMDYNELDPEGWPVFPELNVETVYFATVPNFGYSFNFTYRVAKSFYDSYTDSDLRKSLYFTIQTGSDGTTSENFSNTYSGSWNRFTGLATDELYLIAAETYARTGGYVQACRYLNTMLETRFETNTYVPFASSDETAIIKRVLLERRKQLVGRNRRWFDLKRVQHDPRFAVTLERTVLGTNYSLQPNDPRYVFPIPQSVINVTGMKQNER
ncbi:RagB/SusD family nutrient uptake outer membrane protein [Sphingobacterium alkalisoli]|uniref:RagB/SusD family nutrient uptake outer membrane protein n=1 Tax=Sphingobacterium alkalisoli TaxID=1874115 RepID=A0A4V5LX69_9SPHI|nr:RagB/SusD family nutrient uptake outer membrane protein [Sphingobacterium alkalisoli]TJY61409.1 RagB/SusD family nutrient uptake outer membrane protein [Sphingobacterium alkalisoli]GGH30576.1 membrane protein [Sphingobacterium alkalisoli]